MKASLNNKFLDGSTCTVIVSISCILGLWTVVYAQNKNLGSTKSKLLARKLK